MAESELEIARDVRFTCQQCGDCCRRMDVLLIPGEKETLEDFDWVSAAPRLAGKNLFEEIPGAVPPAPPRFKLGHVERDCVFLEENSGCLIHAVLGYEAKPLVCRLFPVIFADGPDGTAVSASFFCSSVSSDSGSPLSAQEEVILALHRDPLWQAADQEGIRLSGRTSAPETIRLAAGLDLGWPSYRALERAMLSILASDSHPLAANLVASYRLARGAVAESARNARSGASLALWVERMSGEEGEGWLYRRTPGGKAGSPGRQRVALAPLISLVESRVAAEQGGGKAGGALGRVVATARGRGRLFLPSISAEVELERMGHVAFDSDSPSLRPLLVRYLEECVRRHLLLQQPNVLKGSQYLLVSFALMRWYSVALAVARGQDAVGIEELRQAIRTVEKCYVHHSPLSRVLAEQPSVGSVMNLLLSLVASPVDLVTNPYAPDAAAPGRPASDG